MGYLKICRVFLIVALHTTISFPNPKVNKLSSQLSKHYNKYIIMFKAETEDLKTNKGCVNSCCAVCIPGKNCEVLKP